MITLAFIRHCATRGNLEKRYIGRTDEPLCDVGIQQALRLRNHNFPSEHIFVSPMKRTLETAKLIFPERKYITEEDFRETDFGIFEGKSATELSENKEYRCWVDSMCLSPIPDGESVTDFKKRCITAFEKIIQALPENSEVSFVVHGGVIMAVLEAFAENKSNFYDYHINNGEFLLCRFENGKIKF